MKYDAIYREFIPMRNGYDLQGKPKVFDKIDTPCYVIGHTEKSYKIKLMDNTIKTVRKKNVYFKKISDKLSIEQNYNSFDSYKNNQYKH